jgi:hypothetical protein
VAKNSTAAGIGSFWSVVANHSNILGELLQDKDPNKSRRAERNAEMVKIESTG